MNLRSSRSEFQLSERRRVKNTTTAQSATTVAPAAEISRPCPPAAGVAAGFAAVAAAIAFAPAVAARVLDDLIRSAIDGTVTATASRSS